MLGLGVEACGQVGTIRFMGRPGRSCCLVDVVPGDVAPGDVAPGDVAPGDGKYQQNLI